MGGSGLGGLRWQVGCSSGGHAVVTGGGGAAQTGPRPRGGLLPALMRTRLSRRPRQRLRGRCTHACTTCCPRARRRVGARGPKSLGRHVLSCRQSLTM
ncbi:PREDICTED: uncharacterized protein LOC106149160 isoform X2 [Chinchilla lanigera]|uniref:uncharacterized protein LOC106149160 isoform X2 n=1 Tax=Chinchilla lanigera TaxID=34839 RepID=UPI000695BADA|nr:PREDICTED: uncharacterized protein LOC106149160 isoform X2 [Chinchilla lanigera]